MDTERLCFELLRVENHGHEPQSKLWKHFAASCWVFYLRFAGLSSVASLLRSISFTLQISFHSFSANVIDSTNASNFTSFVMPGRYAPGIIRPASFSSLCFW